MSVGFYASTSVGAAKESVFLGTEPAFDKPLDVDDNTFIQEILGDSHHDIYFKQWVNIRTDSDSAKKRILVITNFQIFTIRINLLGRGIRSKFNVVNLSKLATGSTVDTLILTFFDSAEKFSIESPRMKEIVQHILFAYQAVSHGRSGTDLCDWSGVNEALLEGYSSPEPDSQDGLLASYLAYCNALDCSIKIPILDYLMTCFQLQDNSFNWSDCLQFVEKDNTKDTYALASALRFSSYFSELISIDYNLRDSGLMALSTILEKKTAVKKLVLVNCKASNKGFNALSSAIEKGQHDLTLLNISRNSSIGDAGIIRLAEALENSKKVLAQWSMRDVGLGSKGFVPLVNTLIKKDWLAGLKMIDLSENKAGKLGSSALATWLQNEKCQLEQLYAVNCDLDLEIVLKNLQPNSYLYQNALKILNLTGNKFTKKAVPLLCDILSNSISLQHIFLADCDLSKSACVSLLDAAISNQYINTNKYTDTIQFTLDFSKNELGVKGAKEIANLYEKYAKLADNLNRLKNSNVLHTLILAENDFGVEGIVILCNCLKGTNISSLNLDLNVKTGMFTSGKEAGEALADLVKATPRLQQLSLVGDDNKFYLKQALLPVLFALKDNTSLTYLDISKNRIGDEGLAALSSSVFSNNTLTGFNVENNKFTLQGLIELHKATQNNRSLIDWSIPMYDITKIFKGLPEKKIRQLRQIVYEFELFMERNEENHSRSGKKLPSVYYNSLTASELRPEMENNPQLYRERMSLAGRSDSLAGTTTSVPDFTGNNSQPIPIQNPNRLSVAPPVLGLESIKTAAHHRKVASRALDLMVYKARASADQFNVNVDSAQGPEEESESKEQEQRDKVQEETRVKPLTVLDIAEVAPAPPASPPPADLSDSDEEPAGPIAALVHSHASNALHPAAPSQQKSSVSIPNIAATKNPQVKTAPLVPLTATIPAATPTASRLGSINVPSTSTISPSPATNSGSFSAAPIGSRLTQTKPTSTAGSISTPAMSYRAPGKPSIINSLGITTPQSSNSGSFSVNSTPSSSQQAPSLGQAHTTGDHTMDALLSSIIHSANTITQAQQIQQAIPSLIERVRGSSITGPVTSIPTTTVTNAGFRSPSNNNPPAVVAAASTAPPAVATAPSFSATSAKDFLDYSQKYSYEELKSGATLPAGVDPVNKEYYLAPADFDAKFSMKLEEFVKLPAWKKSALKSKVGLF
jgi:Ran GTPase-activating protein (RanGAP) involved in mRNA processing and transport